MKRVLDIFIRSIDIFQYPVIRWITIAIFFTVSSFKMDKVWRKSMVRYFLLHLTRGVFESCERERQILQDVDKTIYSFLLKKW